MKQRIHRFPLRLPHFMMLFLLFSQPMVSDAFEPIEKGFLGAVQKVEAASGKPNALVCYAQAAADPALQKAIEQTDALAGTLSQGWTPESAQFIPLLSSCKNAFDLVRKGSALDFAECPDRVPYGGMAPIPDLAGLQVLAKLLCLEGKYRESLGDYKGAVDCYFVAARMGYHFQSKNAGVMAFLIGKSVKNIALRPLGALIRSGRLDPELLQLVNRKLTGMQMPLASLADCAGVEARWSRACLDESAAWAQSMKSAEGAKAPLGNSAAVSPEVAKMDQFLPLMASKFEADMTLLRELPWKRDYSAYTIRHEAAKSAVRSLLMDPIWNSVEYDMISVHCEAANALVSLAITAAGVELSRKQTGSLPGSLESLAPKILPQLPVDPFSGKPCVYRKAGETYQLFSVGADGKSQDATVKYDPTNGTLSSGDLFF